MQACTSHAGHRGPCSAHAAPATACLPRHGAPRGPKECSPGRQARLPHQRACTGGSRLWLSILRLAFPKLSSSRGNFGGRNWVRTSDPSLVSKVRNVSVEGWKCPDVPSSCGDLGWEWPSVSWSLWWLALGIPAPETTRHDPQPLWRSGRDAGRVVLLMFEAKLPHALVVTLGEHGPPGLAHPVITAIVGWGSPRLASSSLVPFSSKQNNRSCSRPGPARRISYQPPIVPCMASICPRRKTAEEAPQRLRPAPP
jgi:hypothetical protein